MGTGGPEVEHQLPAAELYHALAELLQPVHPLSQKGKYLRQRLSDNLTGRNPQKHSRIKIAMADQTVGHKIEQAVDHLFLSRRVVIPDVDQVADLTGGILDGTVVFPVKIRFQ